MANRVFNVGQDIGITSKESLEVYRDIDTDAVDNYNYKYRQKPLLKDYIAYLKFDTGSSDYDKIEAALEEPQEVDANVLSAIAVQYKLGYDRLLEEYYKFTDVYRYRISKLVNVKAVQNSLHNIFTWIKGERIINPEFGHELHRYLYQGITKYNTEQIVAEIRGCTAKWEPRVNIVNVIDASTVDDTENNTVHLEIIQTIPYLDEKQYNYSFYYNRGE